MSDKQILLTRRSPAYWRVTINHPPLNIFGPDTIPQLNEVSFLAKNQALALCHVEILKRLPIRLQTCSVMIVRGEAVERDQPPCNVVCALMREEISDEVPTASRNNAAPVLGVLFETVALEWVDLIADDAGDLHWCWLTSSCF